MTLWILPVYIRKNSAYKTPQFCIRYLCGKGDSLTKGTHRCFYGHIKVFLKTLIKI